MYLGLLFIVFLIIVWVILYFLKVPLIASILITIAIGLLVLALAVIVLYDAARTALNKAKAYESQLENDIKKVVDHLKDIINKVETNSGNIINNIKDEAGPIANNILNNGAAVIGGIARGVNNDEKNQIFENCELKIGSQSFVKNNNKVCSN